MVSKQPEALRLADELLALHGPTDIDERAAAELRRLYALNADLLEALKSARQDINALRKVVHYGNEQSSGNKFCVERLSEIDAVIAKATGETK